MAILGGASVQASVSHKLWMRAIISPGNQHREMVNTGNLRCETTDKGNRRRMGVNCAGRLDICYL